MIIRVSDWTCDIGKLSYQQLMSLEYALSHALDQVNWELNNFDDEEDDWDDDEDDWDDEEDEDYLDDPEYF